MARAGPLTARPATRTTARRLVATAGLGAASLAVSGRALAAQQVVGARTTDAAIRPTLGVGAVLGTHALGLVSAGLEGDAGLSARLGLTASVGAATGTASAGAGRAVGEVAAIGRFLLDPLRQQAHGVYATGGLALRVERTARPRPFVLAGLGVEGRPIGGPGGRLIPALEAGLGGGARIGLVLRPTRPARR